MASSDQAAIDQLSGIISPIGSNLTNSLNLLDQDIRVKMMQTPPPEGLDAIRSGASSAISSAQGAMTAVTGLLPKLRGAWEIQPSADDADSIASAAEAYAESVNPRNLALSGSWASGSADAFMADAEAHYQAATKAAQRIRTLAGLLSALASTATSSTSQVITAFSEAVTAIVNEVNGLSTVDSAPGASASLSSAASTLSSAKSSGETDLGAQASTGSADLASA